MEGVFSMGPDMPLLHQAQNAIVFIICHPPNSRCMLSKRVCKKKALTCSSLRCDRNTWRAVCTTWKNRFPLNISMADSAYEKIGWKKFPKIQAYFASKHSSFFTEVYRVVIGECIGLWHFMPASCSANIHESCEWFTSKHSMQLRTYSAGSCPPKSAENVDNGLSCMITSSPARLQQLYFICMHRKNKISAYFTVKNIAGTFF